MNFNTHIIYIYIYFKVRHPKSVCEDSLGFFFLNKKNNKRSIVTLLLFIFLSYTETLPLMCGHGS